MRHPWPMVFPSKSPADDYEPLTTARELRLIAMVESFLRQLRDGGSLDPETHLLISGELRAELEPLLLTILRLEASAQRHQGSISPAAPQSDGMRSRHDGSH